MENLDDINIRPFRRGGWISTIDFESKIVEELQQERLAQSRIIAQQLDAIGRLKHALEMMMGERSSRKSCMMMGFIEQAEKRNFVDACVQTALEGPEDEDIRRALGYLLSENMQLSLRHREAEAALRDERQKSRRVLTVCLRVASSNYCKISSTALAKWVSLGLDDGKFATRHRTETFDDIFLPRRNLNESSLSRARSAYSEGDSPRAGLDLDMVYGINFESASVVPLNSVPLSPREAERDADCDLEGIYWTGVSVGIMRMTPEGYLECSKLRGGHVHATVNNELTVMSDDETIGGYFDSARGSVLWEDQSEWRRMDAERLLARQWWTGFSVVKLSMHHSVKGVFFFGKWGERDIDITPASFLSEGEGQLRLTFSDACIELVGNIEPRYLSAGTSVPSRIRWANGMVWDQY